MIYALNGIAANSCLYAQEQTKGMFECVCVSVYICVHLTETTAKYKPCLWLK